MCEDCEIYQPWATITPDIKEAVGWLYVLYEENAAGGMLHVIVDDMHLPARPDSLDGVSRAPTDIERRCLAALLVLTEHQRAPR